MDESVEDARSAPSAREHGALNASEDAIAWAMAHFGADEGIAEAVRPESRDGIVSRLSGLPGDEAQRVVALESWRERARRADRIENRVSLMGGAEALDGPERWRSRARDLLRRGPVAGAGVSVRAQLAVLHAMARDAATLEWPADAESADAEPTNALGLRSMAQMGSRQLTDLLVAMGVWQIAGIVSGKGRRRAARARRKIPSRWQPAFVTGLKHNRDLAIEAATRIQEVYLGLRRRDFGFAETAERLGLFSIASAAGARFESRLQVWLRRIPDQKAGLTRQLGMLNPRALRLRIGPAFRRSLRNFWSHRDEMIEEVGNE